MENIVDAFINKFEANEAFMNVIHEFPPNIAELETDKLVLEKYGFYIKYADYKAVIQFHAPKLVHLPSATTGCTALDIGGGSGYLGYMLKELGYDPVLIDIPDQKGTYPILTKMRDALGMETIYHPVEAFKPLPKLAKAPFSLVTATNLVFDAGWGVAEYAYWLTDIISQTKDDASIYIYFNPPQAEKIWNNPRFLDFFLGSGATLVMPRRAFVLNDMTRLKMTLGISA